MLFRTSGLCKDFGKRRVVSDAAINVAPAEVVGLLGRNGAGKTTTFKMIMGLHRPTEGNIYFQDTEISTLPVFKRARIGIGYLSQEPSVFQQLSVIMNLEAIIEIANLKIGRERILNLLDEYNLTAVKDQLACTLSGGEKRRLEICRVLILSPKLLLLDEPFSGLDPISVHDIQEIVKNLKNKGISVILTDHNVRETLKVCDRSYIVNYGRVIAEGSKEEIVSNKEVVDSYLGASFKL